MQDEWLSEGVEVGMKIEIQEIENNGSVMAVAKGHHDLDEFKRQYAEAHCNHVNGIEKPRHTYMRKTPPKDGYLSWMTECDKGPGAFPATVIGWM